MNSIMIISKTNMAKKSILWFTDIDSSNAFLNKKPLIHPMNRIWIKNHRIGTYEINKIYLSCFDDKIYYILDNGIYLLALGF